jgi:hypothetical protein
VFHSRGFFQRELQRRSADILHGICHYTISFSQNLKIFSPHAGFWIAHVVQFQKFQPGIGTVAMKWIVSIVVCAQLVATGCGLRLSRMTDQQKTERLAAERGRLPDLKDVVDKAKSYITISEILLDFSAGAARDGDLDGMKLLLHEYVAAVRGAEETLMQSDRNPERSPAGFKDFEIALRGQVRRLQDLRSTLEFADREPVDSALASATEAREQVLQRLFPQSRVLRPSVLS